MSDPVANVVKTLKDVFQKYIPWHSESEMVDALGTLDTAVKHLEGDAVDAAETVEQTVKAVENPAPAPAPVPEPAPVEPAPEPVSESAPVATPEAAHFPGTYTPPPA